MLLMLHDELLLSLTALWLQVTKAALLATVLTTLPGLVPACYQYLAEFPAEHIRNRDCILARPALLSV